MKRILTAVLGSSLLLGLTIVTVQARAPKSPAQPPAASGQAAKKAARTFAHPEVEGAMADLKSARVKLEKADDVFGGHRVKAVQAIQEAISECTQALQYAKEHGK